jgi:hypothetical protein
MAVPYRTVQEFHFVSLLAHLLSLPLFLFLALTDYHKSSDLKKDKFITRVLEVRRLKPISLD